MIIKITQICNFYATSECDRLHCDQATTIGKRMTKTGRTASHKDTFEFHCSLYLHTVSTLLKRKKKHKDLMS